LVFGLKPEYARFVAVAGADDERPGSMVFEIGFDGKRAAVSPLIRPRERWHFDVAIPQSASRIYLKCLDGGNGTANDHGDWINAGFRRKGK